MRRRGAMTVLPAVLFIAACGGADPSAEPKPRTIAILRAVASANGQDALLDELRAAGYEVGRNLTLLGGDATREVYPEPDAAAAVVQGWQARGVDLILAFSSRGALAARTAAPGVSILFLVNDPSAVGLVRDEAKPEGRLTGVTFRVPADRTLSLAMRAIPSLRRVGLIYPASDPAAAPHRAAVQRAASSLGLRLVSESFTDVDDVPRAVGALRRSAVQALFISNSPTAIIARDAIRRAAGARMPVIANTAVVDYAVIVLEPDIGELYRQIARQAARILSGTSPSSVPVEDPRRFRLVLNAKRAAAAGLTLPDDVVREADLVVR